jgi:hypothetical protein
MSRGKEIAQAALAAPESEQVGLKILAPGFLSVADAYLIADAHVADLVRDLAKEAKESDRALVRLEKSYDEFLPVARHKADFDAPAASQYATSDDFIAGAEALEDVFEQFKGEPWAQAALSSLSGLIDETAKEYSEQVAMQRQLQKAEQRRAKAAVEARAELLPFRQVVRATFGPTSKEYRDLKDRQGRPTKK